MAAKCRFLGGGGDWLVFENCGLTNDYKLKVRMLVLGQILNF